MKWYERQKQLFAQKKESEAPSQLQNSTYQENPYDKVNPQPVQPYEAQATQQPYENAPSQDQAAYDNRMSDQNQYQETTYQDPVVDDAIYDNYQNNESYQEPRFQSTKNEPHEPTTISQGTLINGNVEADGDLVIRGHVRGDVLCNASLSVYGIVEGIISCNNAYLDNATIIGDIGCSGNMEVTESSTIDGNIEAYELLNGGRIKGNATVGESVRFTATSGIVGDISAAHIEVERGAIIQGNMLIRQEVYFDQR